MKNDSRCALPVLIAALCISALLSALASELDAEDRETLVREDQKKFLESDAWIYDDLERGFTEARKSGKPLLVVFRCIPCESCRGFDEDVAALNPKLRLLMNQFVRVRMPKTNGMDLSFFQFDFDLSFYAFFLNADKTVYGRFGSRSTQLDKKGELSLEAFADAMRAVLDLHRQIDSVRPSLRAKTPREKPMAARPELLPGLEGKYSEKLDYEGKVVQSCIHCHQIRDAERRTLRTRRAPFPDRVLYPYPLPEVFGMHLDPRRRATVSAVDEGSLAERSGFKAGDEIVKLEGQPLVSIADVTWVLHNAPDTGKLAAIVKRGETDKKLELTLEKGWRKASRLWWRVSTWDLRRMGTGGILFEELPDEERAKLGIAADEMALRAKHVGQYGEHANAKRAGVKKGDIIVALDGQKKRRSEAGFIAYAVQDRKAGDSITISVLRDSERLEMRFRLR